MMDEWENEGGLIQQSMEPYIPPWACIMYGHHEHDWLDCVQCQRRYEKYLDDHEQTDQTNQTENNPNP